MCHQCSHAVGGKSPCRDPAADLSKLDAEGRREESLLVSVKSGRLVCSSQHGCLGFCRGQILTSGVCAPLRCGRKMGLDCCLSLNRHGDLLFLFPSSLAGPSSEMETSSTINLKALGAPNVVEDEIDQYLSRQDGKIYRSRDPQL